MTNNELAEKIRKRFNDFGILLNNNQANLFCDYLYLLLEWNEKFNLTAITDIDEIIDKHFVDSCLPYSNFEDNAYIVDIGAGAGFPSIPLKILNPTLRMVLVDSVNKKIIFINEVITKLQLKNIVGIHTRIEDLAMKKEYREKFDYVVSRAVSKLNTLCEYSLPFAKIGGKMVAYKSSGFKEELETSKNALDVLGGIVEKVCDYSFENFDRKLIVIEKTFATDKKYPRSKNKPRIQPL